MDNAPSQRLESVYKSVIVPSPVSIPVTPTLPSPSTPPTPEPNIGRLYDPCGKAKKISGLKKSDIGSPQSFKVVAHYGKNRYGEFEFTAHEDINLPQKFRKRLEMYGLNKTQDIDVPVEDDTIESTDGISSPSNDTTLCEEQIYANVPRSESSPLPQLPPKRSMSNIDEKMPPPVRGPIILSTRPLKMTQEWHIEKSTDFIIDDHNTTPNKKEHEVQKNHIKFDVNNSSSEINSPIYETIGEKIAEISNQHESEIVLRPQPTVSGIHRSSSETILRIPSIEQSASLDNLTLPKSFLFHNANLNQMMKTAENEFNPLRSPRLSIRRAKSMIDIKEEDEIIESEGDKTKTINTSASQNETCRLKINNFPCIPNNFEKFNQDIVEEPDENPDEL